ncbi:MAG: hypothetical protein H0U75_06170 [Legionella sp.]|nr:hypothetical protein [Legionella sp.]
MLNIPFDIFLKPLSNNSNIVLIILLILAALFPKKIMYGLKQINPYSWLIIIFYLLGTLVMEYKTYSYSFPFTGILLTSPLIVTFIYFSQKNYKLLLKNGLLSKKDGFKIDLLLMSTAFLLSGCVLLIVQLNNSDFRSIWPLYLFFISFYGFVFSFLYALIGYLFNTNHKKYTLFLSSIVILVYSSMPLFPKNGWVFNISNVEPFYVLSILLLSLHLLVGLSHIIKRKLSVS